MAAGSLVVEKLASLWCKSCLRLLKSGAISQEEPTSSSWPAASLKSFFLTRLSGPQLIFSLCCVFFLPLLFVAKFLSLRPGNQTRAFWPA